MPCNLNHRELAERAARGGRRRPGGVALPFNTIAVSDNQSQGTPGMRASLDLARGDRRLDRADGPRPRLRRARVPRGLRQDGARRADGAGAGRQARRSCSTAGRCARAAGAGARSTIQDVWEAVGAYRARAACPRADLDELERDACPGAGHLRRAVHRQHDGDRRSSASASRVIGDGLIAADAREEKAAAAARAGALAVALAADGHAGARLPGPPRAAQRDGGDRRDRRLDQRPAAPAGHRPRGRASRSTLDELTAVAARDARDRQPRARRALGRRGPAPGGRAPRR